MNKKDIFLKFFKEIEKQKLLTKFISNIFDYDNLQEYNYIYRMIDNDNSIIIDIYDNVSNNRFNRYIFLFDRGEYNKKIIEENNVFVTYINVLNMKDSDNKLDKLAYLMSLDKYKMIRYSMTFLDNEFIKILKEIIK